MFGSGAQLYHVAFNPLPSPPVRATDVVLPADHMAVIPLASAVRVEPGCTEVRRLLDYHLVNTDVLDVVILFSTRSLQLKFN